MWWVKVSPLSFQEPAHHRYMCITEMVNPIVPNKDTVSVGNNMYHVLGQHRTVILKKPGIIEKHIIYACSDCTYLVVP